MPTPLTANPPDAAALADELARVRLVDADRLNSLMTEYDGGSAADLADFLVRRHALTRFQADRALAGDAGRVSLGPYRLTDPHGPGVLGPLFKADDRTRPGEFVVRVLPLRSLWRVRQAKLLLKALAAVPPHPAVVVPAAVDTANGFHYLAWPRVAGDTLADRVADRGPLRPAEVAAVLARLADGLATLHAKNVTHGAVCPRAVAAPPGGFPRLLELGVGALLAQDLAGEDGLFDTLSAAVAAGHLLDFAAPELLDDPTRPTPAADQFALGAVGYFALTGKPPYPGETLAARLEARQDGQPVPVARVNPTVPPALAAVIDLMLNPDPGGRFPSLDEVRDELTAAGGDELPPADEPDPPAGPPASLMLGRDLPPGARKSGAVSWAAAGSGVAARLPTRDDSDASISFDLPPPPPEPVTREVPSRTLPQPAAETPNRLAAETQPSSGKLPKPRPADRPPADTPTGRPKLPGAIPGKGGAGPPLPKIPGADTRLALPTPVQYHTGPADVDGGLPVADEADGRAGPGMSWRKLRRNLLFWQGAKDTVQVSVYGPPSLATGASARLAVFVHDPASAASVRTLARAFQLDAELLGTGTVTDEVARGSELAVHLTVANAGVATSLVRIAWRGQPQRLVFDLHVPWESPGGAAPGLVSVGRENVRIGKAEFRLHIQPRTG